MICVRELKVICWYIYVTYDLYLILSNESDVSNEYFNISMNSNARVGLKYVSTNRSLWRRARVTQQVE